MYLKLFALVGTASTTAAMPGMAAVLNERQSLPSNLPLSSQEGNSGPIPSLQFSAADQFVDVRPGTTHQFIAPGPNDKRGPCPGLNAAANHGFLPRSGITTVAQSKLHQLSSIMHVAPFINIFQLLPVSVKHTASDPNLLLPFRSLP
jgi:hypothetical protein